MGTSGRQRWAANRLEPSKVEHAPPRSLCWLAQRLPPVKRYCANSLGYHFSYGSHNYERLSAPELSQGPFPP